MRPVVLITCGILWSVVGFVWLASGVAAGQLMVELVIRLFS